MYIPWPKRKPLPSLVVEAQRAFACKCKTCFDEDGNPSDKCPCCKNNQNCSRYCRCGCRDFIEKNEEGRIDKNDIKNEDIGFLGDYAPGNPGSQTTTADFGMRNRNPSAAESGPDCLDDEDEETETYLPPGAEAKETYVVDNGRVIDPATASHPLDYGMPRSVGASADIPLRVTGPQEEDLLNSQGLINKVVTQPKKAIGESNDERIRKSVEWKDIKWGSLSKSGNNIFLLPVSVDSKRYNAVIDLKGRTISVDGELDKYCKMVYTRLVEKNPKLHGFKFKLNGEDSELIGDIDKSEYQESDEWQVDDEWSMTPQDSNWQIKSGKISGVRFELYVNQDDKEIRVFFPDSALTEAYISRDIAKKLAIQIVKKTMDPTGYRAAIGNPFGHMANYVKRKPAEPDAKPEQEESEESGSKDYTLRDALNGLADEIKNAKNINEIISILDEISGYHPLAKEQIKIIRIALADPKSYKEGQKQLTRAGGLRSKVSEFIGRIGKPDESPTTGVAQTESIRSVLDSLMEDSF